MAIIAKFGETKFSMAEQIRRVPFENEFIRGEIKFDDNTETVSIKWCEKKPINY
jgi:hypothetical protein